MTPFKCKLCGKEPKLYAHATVNFSHCSTRECQIGHVNFREDTWNILMDPGLGAGAEEGWLTLAELEAEENVPAFQVANKDGVIDLKACRAVVFDKLVQMAKTLLEVKQ